MLKFLLVTAFFSACLLSRVQAQEKCGIVIDTYTKSSIPYATVSTLPFSNGAYTSDDGHYCFSVNTQTDSVAISCLGYKVIVLAKKSFFELDTIMMIPTVNQLNEVTVRSKSSKKVYKTVGYADNAFRKRSFGQSISVNSGIKVATYLRNDEKLKGTLRNVLYLLSETEDRKGRESPLVYKLRLRIFDNKNELPGNDILTEQIIIDVSNKQNEIKYNLEKYNIDLPTDGLWIGLECVGYVSKDSIYHEMKAFEFGKYSLKNSKKMKIANYQIISPMFPMTKRTVSQSAYSFWNGKWFLHKGKDDFNTFSFGGEIELN